MSDATAIDLDLTQLRRAWDIRRAALRTILARIDTRGMTRPARDPEERAWLEQRGPMTFIEDEEAAKAARAYYERKYRR
jgi:hypothetical protein